METKSLTFLKFPLAIEERWPPVSSESLPFKKRADTFCAMAAPLFVKDISVGDVIEVIQDDEGIVKSWKHITRSNRTTVWLLRISENEQISGALKDLRKLGCNTVGLEKFGCYAVDVPESVSIINVDIILNSLDSNCIAVAFPSMRHPD